MMAAITQAGHVVSVAEGPNPEEIAYALRSAFVQAFTSGMASLLLFVVQCCSSCCTILGTNLSASVNGNIFLSSLSFPLICQVLA